MGWKNWLVTAMVVPALAIGACADETAGSGEEAVTETGTAPAPDPPADDGDGAGDPGSPTDPDCPHSGPDLIDPETLKACPSYVCEQGAHCVPNGLVPADFQSYLHRCNDDSFCVPDPFIRSGGNSFPPSCTAILGLEGRCLSGCIEMVQQRGKYLRQDICDDGELCAPCFDPFSFEPTGACELSCDPGSIEGVPEPQPSCCTDGNGTCLPTDIVGSDAASLAQDACPEAGTVCVPNQMLAPDWDAIPCEPDWILQWLGIDDGACLPACVDAVKSIGQGSCPGGYKCAPCDALGESTGACGDDW